MFHHEVVLSDVMGFTVGGDNETKLFGNRRELLM